MKTDNLNSPYIPFADFPKAPDLEMSLRIIAGGGIFERSSFSKFMSHIKDRRIVIEVGAHVGSWTLGFSKLFQTVVAFEPQPGNRNYLEKNMQRAKVRNVDIYPFAVVNDLTQEFKISANGSTRNSGMAHLIPNEIVDETAVPVRTITLDQFWASAAPSSQSQRIDALKIDVEGMELNVLKGGEQIVREHKPVILLEINQNCERYRICQEDIFDYMNNAGYKNIDRSRNDYTFAPKNR